MGFRFLKCKSLSHFRSLSPVVLNYEGSESSVNPKFRFVVLGIYLALVRKHQHQNIACVWTFPIDDKCGCLSICCCSDEIASVKREMCFPSEEERGDKPFFMAVLMRLCNAK